MDPNNKKDQKNNQNRNRNMRGVVTLIIWALVLTVVFNYINAYSNNLTKRASSHEIPYSQLIDLIQEDQVAELKIENGVLYATPVDGYVYTEEATDKNKEPKSYTQSEKTPLILYTTALNDASLLPLLEEHNVKYTSPVQTQMSPILEFMITYVLPVIVLAALFMLVMRIMAKNGGIGGIGSVGKSNAKVYMEKSTGVTFKDVAGQDEAKESLEEIIDFLHNPQKYTAIGARLPKGALLVGSPGTGKTLLAKAVAGEANVPFFSISGSDFVEMFVGVGASRVRDLFKEAAKVAPCIIFIDEIDTIGKSRDGGRYGGGNDEREQTLNQLLVEMDGFGTNQGVVVMAATNRADILDPALLRPGRFDRQVYVGLPDIRGREEILKIHVKNKPLAEDVDLSTVAKGTPGFTGADLENLSNEAALLAARRGSKLITMSDFSEAEIKVIAGPEKKSRVVSEHERKLTAYHEAGHAIVMHALPTHDPVHQITIVPRGGAGGMTISLPTEDRSYQSKRYMEEQIVSLLGGRVAEKLMLGDISTGASNDIQRASQIARKMVSVYGMSDRLGSISFESGHDEIFIGRSMAQAKPYSEQVAAQIDEEVKSIIDAAYERCEDILSRDQKHLIAVAEFLLAHETMSAEEFEAVFTDEAAGHDKI